MLTKVCTLCKTEFPATAEYFTLKRARKDGLDSWCRKCKNNYDRKGREPQKIMQPRSIKSGYKMCTKCLSVLPASMGYFGKSKRGKYGIGSICKSCAKAYRATNSEAIKETKRKHYVSNQDYYKSKTKEWYKENKGKAKEYNKKYVAAYRKTEHGKHTLRKNYQAYLTKKRGNISLLSVEDWEKCLKYFDYKDAYTGLPMKVISQDHVIPLSKGGMYVKSNIVPCELSINSSKNDSDMEEWYLKQPFFSKQRLNKIYKWIGYDKKTNTQQLALA